MLNKQLDKYINKDNNLQSNMSNLSSIIMNNFDNLKTLN